MKDRSRSKGSLTTRSNTAPTNRDGVVEETKQLTFTIVAHDAPVTTATVLPEPVDGKVTGPARIVLSAKDSGVDVTKTEFSVDGGPFQEYEGPFMVEGFTDHTVEYFSTNADGAVETTKQVTFTIVPHEAPVTSASISPKPDPVTNNVVGPATVTLAATENGGGVTKTEFSVDGGPFQEYEGPFTVEGFTDHTVEYFSTNADGAVEATKQVTFTIVAHDAPVTTASVLPEPVNGTVTGSPAKVVLAATDHGVDIAGTEFNLDGAGFQPYTGPITVAGFGDHTVEFRSTNADGVVEATKQVTFTIARHDAPSTAATVLPEPVDGKVTGPAKVVLAPTDNGGGVAGTEFKLDGGAFQPYAGPIAVSSFGDHTVEFRSTNGDGAVEATKQVTFTIVAARPTGHQRLDPAGAGRWRSHRFGDGGPGGDREWRRRRRHRVQTRQRRLPALRRADHGLHARRTHDQIPLDQPRRGRRGGQADQVHGGRAAAAAGTAGTGRTEAGVRGTAPHHRGLPPAAPQQGPGHPAPGQGIPLHRPPHLRPGGHPGARRNRDQRRQRRRRPHLHPTGDRRGGRRQDRHPAAVLRQADRRLRLRFQRRLDAGQHPHRGGAPLGAPPNGRTARGEACAVGPVEEFFRPIARATIRSKTGVGSERPQPGLDLGVEADQIAGAGTVGD